MIPLTILAMLLAQEAKPPEPPKIDYKLMFEVRTAELRYQNAQQALQKAAQDVSMEYAKLRAVCGTSFVPDIDKESGEYRCIAAHTGK